MPGYPQNPNEIAKEIDDIDIFNVDRRGTTNDWRFHGNLEIHTSLREFARLHGLELFGIIPAINGDKELLNSFYNEYPESAAILCRHRFIAGA